MVVDKVHEPIRVIADFNGKKVRPLSFFRDAGRQYDIATVNLVFRKQIGDRYHWCFAVSDEANTYVLSYDPESLGWMLEEVQME